MTRNITRATRRCDVTVGEHHIRAAQARTQLDTREHSWDSAYLAAALIPLGGSTAICGIAAALGAAGGIIAALIVAAAVGTAGAVRTVWARERRESEQIHARNLAYIEAVRGRDVTAALTAWENTDPSRNVADVADAITVLALACDADRVHQLTVVAQRNKDWGIFETITVAGANASHTHNIAVAQMYPKLVTTIANARGEFPNTECVLNMILDNAAAYSY